ncbi:2554_t:CDS:2, partial [Paraglomus brasilianum]
MTTTRGKERQSILSHVFKQILSDPPIPSKKRTFEDVFTPSKCFPDLWQTRQELREKEDLLLSKGRTTRAGRLRIERQTVGEKIRQDAKDCTRNGWNGDLHDSGENVNEGINKDMTKETINENNSEITHKRKRQKSNEISADKHSREITNQLNTELDGNELSCNDNTVPTQLTNHAKQVTQNNTKRKSRDLTESERKKVKTAKPDVIKRGRGRPKKYETTTSYAQSTQLVHPYLATHSPTHIETKVPRLRLILKKRCEPPLQSTDASHSSTPAYTPDMQNTPNDKKKSEGKTGLVPLDPLKESQLRSVLCTTKKQLSIKAARMKRKLLLRESKRAVQLPIFDIDIWIHNHMRSGVDLLPITYQSPQPNSSSLSSPLPTSQDTSQQQGDDSSRSEESPVLQESDCVNAASTDRSEIESSLNRTKSIKRPLSRYLTSFASRIHGVPCYWRTLTNPSPLLSAYTSTPLPPYVFRDYWTRPPKLLLLHSILTYPHRDKPSSSSPLSSPIDFCYFQPEHLLQ